MPCPPRFGNAPVTKIRNTKSAHWRKWLGPANRCVVPFTSFCEYADTKSKKTPTWFGFSEKRPLAVFAGLWCSWHGNRGKKANPVEGDHTLFGFLTTEANDVVAAVHPKAMPVILTTADEIDALKLQRPLPDGVLKIVATGERKDKAPEFV
jgi:putative SOS response-associated peptidase YedK